MYKLGSDMCLDLGKDMPRGKATLETLFAYVEEGLSSARALQMATWYGGKLLGRSDLGVLEVGALADVIAVEGDPLDGYSGSEKTVWVMEAGKGIFSSKPFIH
jgi:imidazolonepropionase-like amidohydrolase